LVGFMVAAIAWSVLALWLGLAVGQGLAFSRLLSADSVRFLLWPIGPLGAAVGALLWLIGRPDRTFD
jgi:membrane protein DedA with SNARE-associated domain